MTILVTGTGGGAGQSVLKSLQNTDYRVIAADGDVLGAGMYAAAKGYRVPYANSPMFIERLLSICQTEQVRLLFPGLDAELPVLSRHREAFASIGVTVVVSDEGVVALCDDKLATARFLQDQGFPAPKTWGLRDCPADGQTFPLVLKPRTGGARSKGVRIVRTPEELSRAQEEVDPAAYVSQEFIEGPEFTCGTVMLNGGCVGVIVMRRILRDGDTYKAFVERHESLEEFVAAVAGRLKPFGPCNLQLRLRDEVPYILEFNARCSGTTYCRALAGFNEPRMIADSILKGIAPTHAIRPLTVLRYWKEMVVENEAIANCERTGEVSRCFGPL